MIIFLFIGPVLHAKAFVCTQQHYAEPCAIAEALAQALGSAYFVRMGFSPSAMVHPPNAESRGLGPYYTVDATYPQKS